MRNPPWSDRAIKESWEAIEAALASSGIPEQWMPRGDMIELGCGHYGCVYPTSDPKIVFKVTTDETEAKFVANYLTLRDKGVQSMGIVQYYEIFGLPMRRFGRPVYVLWREEVKHTECQRIENIVMKDAYTKSEENYLYLSREWRSFVKHVMSFKGLAHDAKRVADRKFASVPEDAYYQWIMDQIEYIPRTYDWSEEHAKRVAVGTDRGNYRFALLFQMCMSLSQELGSEYFGVNVGNALETYLDAGLFLADVHCGNIGMTDRSEEIDGRQPHAPIITDPGHSIALNRDVMHPKIMMLDI